MVYGMESFSGVIRGVISNTLRPEAARRLRRLIPDCRLNIISGTGHFPPMKQPEAPAERIVQFVQGFSPPIVDYQLPGVKNGGPGGRTH